MELQSLSRQQIKQGFNCRKKNYINGLIWGFDNARYSQVVVRYSTKYKVLFM